MYQTSDPATDDALFIANRHSAEVAGASRVTGHGSGNEESGAVGSGRGTVGFCCPTMKTLTAWTPSVLSPLLECCWRPGSRPSATIRWITMSGASERPYVLLSCAMSVDGYINDTSSDRLLLSNDDDFDRVDGQRALADAVLVGATTFRNDNPRLLVRSTDRRADRQQRGLPVSPVKVTITGSGNLDPQASFFTAGGTDVAKLVYCASPAVRAAQDRLSMAPSTSVIDASSPLDLVTVLTDLAARGIRRLMVEGGQHIHTQFLAAGLADELQLVIAPFFVGDAGAPRFVGAAAFLWDSGHRMTLAEPRQIGDVALLRYLLTPRALGEQPVAQADSEPISARD